MAGLETVGARNLAEDRVAVLLRDVLVRTERFPPGEARLRIEFLIERVVVLDFRARQGRKIVRADIGDAIVGPAVGRSEMAVGKADPLAQRVHLIGESLLGSR